MARYKDMTNKILITAIRLVVALVLLTPFIVMAPPLPDTFFPYVVGKALYSRTLIEVAFGLWVILIMRNPSFRTPRSWLLLIFAAYLTAALLSSLYGVSPQRSLWSTYERMQGTVDLAHWFVFAVVITSVFRSWTDWRRLLTFNLSVSALLGMLGLSQYFDFKVLGYLSGDARIDITFGNATYVGAYMVINILVSLGFLVHSLIQPEQQNAPRAMSRRYRRKKRNSQGLVGLSSEKWWRTFWIAVILLDSIVLYLSGTRGAMIGLAAGLASFATTYLIWGQSKQVRWASLGLIGTLLGLILIIATVRNTPAFQSVAGTSTTLSRLANTGVDDASLKGRMNSTLLGLKGFAAKPIFGWGPENFTIAYDRYLTAEMIDKTVISFDQAHNKLIEELTTKGIVGFVGYVSIWIYMFWVIARMVRGQSAQNQVFTLFAGAALAAYFVQNLFLFDTPGTVGQYILLLGFVAFIETSDESTSAPIPKSHAKPQTPSSTELGVPKILRSDMSYVIVAIATSALILLAVFLINYLPYKGATLILMAFENAKIVAPETASVVSYDVQIGQRIIPGDTLVKLQTPLNQIEMVAEKPGIVEAILHRPGAIVARGDTIAIISIPWEERINRYKKSIDAFPPLANYPRIAMFQKLSDKWWELNDEEARLALNIVAREGEDAIKSEPEEWRIFLTLANIYQQMGPADPTYVEQARILVYKGQELAPQRVEVYQLIVRQKILEENYQGASDTINEYLKKNPASAPYFEVFRKEIDRVIGQQ